MKLEIGMYIRTKDGYISQYKYYDTMNMGKILCMPLSNRTFANIEDIAKFSYNIIDLIEIGDYVNGYKIGYIDDCKGAMREFYYDYENPKEDVGHWEEEIKSIVTKEQFEYMEYRIGE